MSDFQEKQMMKDEQEANQFAMELLIPYKMIMADLENINYIDIEGGPPIPELAKKYQVSEQLMLIRILELRK